MSSESYLITLGGDDRINVYRTSGARSQGSKKGKRHYTITQEVQLNGAKQNNHACKYNFKSNAEKKAFYKKKRNDIARKRWENIF